MNCSPDKVRILPNSSPHVRFGVAAHCSVSKSYVYSREQFIDIVGYRREDRDEHPGSSGDHFFFTRRITHL